MQKNKEEIQEIITPIQQANTVLLILNPNRISLDSLSAYFSLFYTLKKIGKVVKFYPRNIPEYFQKLSFPLKEIKTFCIQIDYNKGVVSDLYYRKNSDTLKIFLTLANGEITPDHIKFVDLQKSSEIDLIVTLGLQNLEDLEEIYEKNFKLFFTTPLVNIDNTPLNSEFGQINYIETTRPLSETILKLIKGIDKNLIDKPIATNLLAGILKFYKDHNKKISASLLFDLYKNGADINLIAQYFKVDSTLIPLIEALFKNSELINNVVFIFLNQELPSKRLILRLLSLLRSDLFLLDSFCVFLPIEKFPPKYQVVFYYPDSEILQKVLQYFKGQTNKNVGLFEVARKPETIKKEILNLITHGTNYR